MRSQTRNQHGPGYSSYDSGLLVASCAIVTVIGPNMNKNKVIQYYLNEHRVTLEDSLINFLGFDNKKVLNYLNFDDRYEETTIPSHNPHFQIHLNLSKKVKYQRRIVYDIFVMLSDVGGLYGIIHTTLAVIIGYYSKNFYTLS